MIIAIDGPAASGKGTLGQAPRGAFRPAASRHRPPLPGRGPRPARHGTAPRRRGGRGPDAPRRSTPRTSTIRACAAPRWARPPPSSRPSSRCAMRSSRCSALRGPARRAPCSTGATSARSSARMPTRSSSSPRPPRSARGAGIASFGDARRGRPTYETILADIRRRDERDTTRSTAPLAASRRRLDPRHDPSGRKRSVSGGAPADRGERPLTPRESRRHVARVVRADQLLFPAVPRRGSSVVETFSRLTP